MGKNLTKRAEDYSKWYNELVVKADMAENSGVRGCMVIKPYGYAIWEKMQKELDRMFKETGHENAYFPLFVPKSMFEAEEKNAEGFAKECAIVTHYRLKNDPDRPGKLMVDPNAQLEEALELPCKRDSRSRIRRQPPFRILEHSLSYIFIQMYQVSPDRRFIFSLAGQEAPSSLRQRRSCRPCHSFIPER